MAEEKKKLSPLTLTAGAGASILSMVIGSFFHTAGTIAGAAIGSVTYSVGAFWIEDKARKTRAKITARKQQNREPYERLAHLPSELAVAYAETSKSITRNWSIPRRIGASAGILGLCLASAVAVLFTIEAATGKTLSSNLGRGTEYGTTLGGYSTHKPSPAPAVTTVTPTQTAPSSVPAGSGEPSGVSPDMSPTVTLTPSATYTGISSGGQ